MNALTDLALVALVLLNLGLAGSGRLKSLVSFTAAQGILLGALTLFTREPGWHAALLALGGAALKGVVFPRMLNSAIRQAEVRLEVEPYVGYSASVLLSAAALAFSIWLGGHLRLEEYGAALAPSAAALHTVLTGFFLMTARRKALTQVMGYLVLENGIYAFGLLLPGGTSAAVELGLMLDIFVAVFVMGIMVFHINREFEDMDTEKMALLREDGGDD